ncbi:MAG: 50S ribosomal protein L9 [Deltaproteobacteria bacterium CG11_big_fil_rev_8_21_14_0_20_47_16]|nr:MAG: 50S ribosomal protein L9 [Deltaproteobacteria bacterium CG11_big_fil_rev_8_21_14_0_20_47_16]
MEIILQEDVEALGKAGEIVKVRAGFARNFLLPKKKAVLANAGNLKGLEHFRKVAAAKQAKLTAEAQAKAAELSKLQLTIEVEVGEEGKLFGSVTTSDIVAQIKAKGQSVEKQQIQLKEHIKQVGSYSIPVKLQSDVIAQVALNVVASTK